MGKTNSLTSHHGESRSHRVDKMSGLLKEQKDFYKGKTKKHIKRFTNKKRRGMLNNPEFFDKF